MAAWSIPDMMRLVRLEGGYISASSAPAAEAYDVVGEDDADREAYGPVDLIQTHGVASLPADPDDSGYCEGILIENFAGRPGIVIAARDTRCFSIFGKLSPGDTVVHSTGPNKSAQMLCKEKKKQVVLATIGPDGKQITCMVDGKNGQAQMQAFGFTLTIDKNGIHLEAGNCGLHVGPNGVQAVGACQFGGLIIPPVGPTCMAIASPAVWAAINTSPVVAPVVSGGQFPVTPVLNVRGAP
jgi:hypothetical protein